MENIGLIFSWSSKSIQDTLLVATDQWTKCYIWSDRFEEYNGFVGISGSLFQSWGIHAQQWRYLANPIDMDIDEDLVIQTIGYQGAECDSIVGRQLLFEMDVFIEVDLVSAGNDSIAGIGLLPFGVAPVAPEVYFRVVSDEPCFFFSMGTFTDTQLIYAKAIPVATQHTSFGKFKAIYR
jgi:hypothetical protein